MRPEFSAVRFHDPDKAEGNLARLDQQLAPALRVTLGSLLAQSPDPDGALNLLERYAEAAGREVLGELAPHPSALTYLVAIFGHSAFLAEALLSDPGWAAQLARDRNFTKLKSREDLMQDFARFSTTSPDPWLSAQLARFKRRNYLRIVLKDVLGLSTLGETTLELSTLADVILTNALLFCDRELEKRHGRPQYRDAQGRIERAGFSIVSLGKLGGNELNYSSDIDLLFLYSHDGETAGGTERGSALSNKEYAVRLAHAITRTITQTTHYGSVFRVDLRLRPEGEQGDLAISVKSALEYYEHRARDWELQMLIRARHSAGEARVTREFLHGVEAYVYGAPADFRAIESVLLSREKMSQKLRESRSSAIDVKLHRGGIRDIEFLTQCLQRLHGGSEPWVRSGSTLQGLRKLNDKGLLSDREYAALTSSYEFLRKLEHRLQLDIGQQTHRLPTEPEALDRLARRLGIDAAKSPGSALLRCLQEAFARVDEIYQRVIHPRAPSEASVAFRLRPPPTWPTSHGPHSYRSTLEFLDAQAPDLAQLVREAAMAERARPNVARFFASLLGSSESFRLAREQPQLVRRAVEVIGASEYLGELLIHHPDDLAVWEPVDLAAAESASRVSAGAPAGPRGQIDQVAQVEMTVEVAGEGSALPYARLRAPALPFPWAMERGLSIGERMAFLRRHYRTHALDLGAADLSAPGSIFTALSRWSALAARVVRSALWIAADALDQAAAPGPGAASAARLPLAVFALGRLGLNEFDLASDADLLFVAAPGTPRDDLTLWTRLAEKTIEVLSSYTRDGTLFAVDTRLRPRGREGELVITENQLLAYVSESAQVWEGLTYLKAAPVAGNIELGLETASHLTARLLERFASYPDLEGELREMRRRLEREVTVRPSNTKTAPGGYYDVDFCVSYLRLRHHTAGSTDAINLPPGANIAEQIAALRAAGLMSGPDARALTAGAAVLRNVDHAVRLVTGRPADGLPEHVGQAESVESLTRRWGLLADGQTLVARLRETQEQVRTVYRRLVGSE
jgi:glutamate-ammonia-ligase adenylyltransferase